MKIATTAYQNTGVDGKRRSISPAGILMNTATTSSRRRHMNTEKIPKNAFPIVMRTSAGRFAPLCRSDIIPATKSCTAPPRIFPTGIIRNTTAPNLIPRITPITGPTPAIFSS